MSASAVTDRAMGDAPPAGASYAQLEPGDPMPHCRQRTLGRPLFNIDSLAGRYLVFAVFGSAGSAEGRAALAFAGIHRDLFDDQRMSFFGISVDPEDEAQGRLREALPGIRMVCDMDGAVSRKFGALPREERSGEEPAGGGRTGAFRPFWMVVDPSLHVMARLPFGPESQDRLAELLLGLPHPARFAGFELPPPILILPGVFEPGLCRHLIGLYDQDTREETGVMRDGIGVVDRSFKSRRDFEATDPELIRTLQSRIHRRVVPEIARIFFARITRMERYIVGCYAAEDGGHFQPHRDNSQPITAHRRFAVSINLNGEFEGGAVSFPEYSPRGYKVPPGWAVVFPCNLLHAVSTVSAGRRYAFLPFVYDEEGARIRADNAAATRQPEAGSEAGSEVRPTPPAAQPAMEAGVA